MGEDTTQPTPISSDTYERFGQFVEDVHGARRGNLRTELENALDQYRKTYYDDGDADARLTRIEDDVATMKAMLAEAETDGATTLPGGFDDGSHTHARSASNACTDDGDPNALPFVADAPDTKPGRNQPRGPKADYLAAEIDRRVDGVITPPAVTNIVKEVYDFGDRTASDLTDMILDRIPHEDTPPSRPDNEVCWGKRADKLWDEWEAEQQDDEDDTDDVDWSDMDDAERGQK